MSALLAVLPHQRTCLPLSVLSSRLNASMGYAGVSSLFLVQSCGVRGGEAPCPFGNWELPLLSMAFLRGLQLTSEQQRASPMLPGLTTV